MLTVLARVAAFTLAFLNGGNGLQEDTKMVNGKYFHIARPNSLVTRNCIRVTFNGEKNAYTHTEWPTSITDHMRSYNNDTEYIIVDGYPELSWRPATLLSVIRWGANKGPLNRVAVQSCAAHCTVEPKKPVYCHDPRLAPKCRKKKKNIFQAACTTDHPSQCPLPTFGKSANPNVKIKLPNSNKLKRWKARPKFKTM